MVLSVVTKYAKKILEIVETSVDTPQPDLTNGRGFRWIGGVG